MEGAVTLTADTKSPSPALRLASRRATQAALDPEIGDLYPDGTSFVPADIDRLTDVLHRTLVEERRPAAVISEDGEEILIMPRRRAGLLGVLLGARYRLAIRDARWTTEEPHMEMDGRLMYILPRLARPHRS
jgi:hypothetical protein